MSHERSLPRRKSSADARTIVQSVAPSCARAFLQRADDHWIIVDQRRLRGAARQRFESERAGTREQIETTRAVEPRRQPIEQGLARAIGRRT